MNGAPPDWQDGECCFRCRTQFTLVARKHHCRNCGNIFCAKCSSQSIPLPKLNIDKPVRVCDGCYDKVSNKNNDSLTLALPSSSSSTTANSNTSKSNDNSDQQSKAQKSRSSGSASSTKTTSSTSKTSANASAPSEQELKEEEELQLALALSLSEAPAKVTFPDCKQFEEPPPPSSSSSSAAKKLSSSASNNRASSFSATSSSSIKSNIATNINGNVEQMSKSFDSTTGQYLNDPLTSKSSIVTQPLSGHNDTANKTLDYEDVSAKDQTGAPSGAVVYKQQYPMQDVHLSERDLEVFRFVAEVQSTSEVFMNRVASCKLRNRSLVNDSAVQSLFLKMNDMHAKIMEYIGDYEKERASFETLQDKLAQITDARAALDALRSEHQEKIRQEAAEAERQRQSQLALKLEAMRQKKTQMMQHTKELALQRIQAQEMMLRQQQQQQPTPQSQPPTQVTYSQVAPATVTSGVSQPGIAGHSDMMPHYQIATDPTSLQTHSTSSAGQSHQIELPNQPPPMQTVPPHSQVVSTPTSQPMTAPSHSVDSGQQQQLFQSSAPSSIQQIGSSYSHVSLPQMPQFTVPPPAQPAPVEDDAPLISFDD